MKTSILSFVCLCAFLSQAQTAIIAHKSHSGSSIDFFIDPSSNFGDPYPILVQVIRLNDTVSVEVSESFNGFYFYDTIYKSPIYSKYDLNIDSMNQNHYWQKVEYIHFKNSPDSLKAKKPINQIQLFENSEKVPEIAPTNQPVQENNPKKKKKSYLLFLFGITGGGMLLMKLFRKPQITKQLIS
jgi:hypothetical protein